MAPRWTRGLDHGVRGANGQSCIWYGHQWWATLARGGPKTGHSTRTLIGGCVIHNYSAEHTTKRHNNVMNAKFAYSVVGNLYVHTVYGIVKVLLA